MENLVCKIFEAKLYKLVFNNQKQNVTCGRINLLTSVFKVVFILNSYRRFFV